MIEISTMTSSFRDKHTGHIDHPEAIRRCKATGFDILDLTLHPVGKNDPAGNDLAGDDWESYLDKILQARDECGVTFYQTHPIFRKGAIRSYDNPEEEAFFWKIVRRNLEITARIGAKYAILHPVNDPSTLDIDTQIALNHQVYDEYVDLAAKLGIGIAFENMVESPQLHRFSSLPEELIALHDSYNCDHVKLCWDFGHGNTAVPDRYPEAIRMLGSRLKCTHIDDNHGGKDEHLLPFLGTVPWETVMPVLKEIGYTGTLNLEVGFNKKMPDDLKDAASMMTYQILRKLQALTEG